MWGPKQEKARKPRLLRLYCWIFSMRVSEEERSVRDGVLTCSRSERQAGPFIALKHIQAILYLIRSEIGSQSCFSRVVSSGGGWVPREGLFQQSFEFSERLDDRLGCTHEETVTVGEQ